MNHIKSNCKRIFFYYIFYFIVSFYYVIDRGVKIGQLFNFIFFYNLNVTKVKKRN